MVFGFTSRPYPDSRVVTSHFPFRPSFLPFFLPLHSFRTRSSSSIDFHGERSFRYVGMVRWGGRQAGRELAEKLIAAFREEGGGDGNHIPQASQLKGSFRHARAAF